MLYTIYNNIQHIKIVPIEIINLPILLKKLIVKTIELSESSFVNSHSDKREVGIMGIIGRGKSHLAYQLLITLKLG